jgi:hypothetical protein
LLIRHANKLVLLFLGREGVSAMEFDKKVALKCMIIFIISSLVSLPPEVYQVWNILLGMTVMSHST